MNSNGFFYRITLALFLLSLSVVAGAQGAGVLRGVVEGTKASQKAVEQSTKNALKKAGISPSRPIVANVPGVQNILVTKTDTLPIKKAGQEDANGFLGVYLDCLAIEDDALWNDKAPLLCRRLSVLDKSKSEKQWREYVDSGRFRKIRFLILLRKLDMRSLEYLVGPEEEYFGREEGLLAFRLDE